MAWRNPRPTRSTENYRYQDCQSFGNRFCLDGSTASVGAFDFDFDFERSVRPLGSAEGVAPFVEPPRLGAKQRTATAGSHGSTASPAQSSKPTSRRSPVGGIVCPRPPHMSGRTFGWLESIVVFGHKETPDGKANKRQGFLVLGYFSIACANCR